MALLLKTEDVRAASCYLSAAHWAKKQIYFETFNPLVKSFNTLVSLENVQIEDTLSCVLTLSHKQRRDLIHSYNDAMSQHFNALTDSLQKEAVYPLSKAAFSLIYKSANQFDLPHHSFGLKPKVKSEPFIYSNPEFTSYASILAEHLNVPVYSDINFYNSSGCLAVFDYLTSDSVYLAWLRWPGFKYFQPGYSPIPLFVVPTKDENDFWLMLDYFWMYDLRRTDYYLNYWENVNTYKKYNFNWKESKLSRI